MHIGDTASKVIDEQHKTLSDYWRSIWRECSAISGIAAEYLSARRCAVPPTDSDLRWHGALKHPSGYVGAALVALITDTETGNPVSLHRTWIRGDGSKPVEPARLLAKGHRKAGGVIRLWPDDAVTDGLAICEGIETALSIAHVFRPVWSCIDAGNLAEFPVLAGIESLTICADHDPAGLRAAETCAARWLAARREVRITTPDAEGSDFNDAARAANDESTQHDRAA